MHWSWFCNNLKQALSLDWEAVTFISDRGTGLVPAMGEVFPENEHRHCVVHISRNIVGRFKVKSLAALVYNAAKKTTKEGCDRWLEEIKKASEGAFEYINSIEHKLWATYAMDKPNYGHVTSNIAESNNSVLKEDRTSSQCMECSQSITRDSPSSMNREQNTSRDAQTMMCVQRH